VPAAFNNIVGLKPSRGVISTTGVVPACRSLDCVSVFAATCEDAARVAEIMRGFDATDPSSRPEGEWVDFAPAPVPPRFRFAVPAGRGPDLHDGPTAQVFDVAIANLVAWGGTPVEIDFTPFRQVADTLYKGPFVAERLEAAGALLASNPDALLPPIRSILEGATRWTAGEALAATNRLAASRRDVAPLWRDVDFLLVPTAPRLPTVDELAIDPLGPNAALGLTCNFVNLLDLAALAVPVGLRPDGLPAGVTLVGPWGSDARLAGFGSRLHRATSQTVGATTAPLRPVASGVPPAGRGESASGIDLVVVGAHLSGEPLNHQLTSVGGRFVRACRTAPVYRLFELPNTTPPKPGLVRAGDHETDGANAANATTAIEVEVWRLSPAAFGAFVAAVPQPLCIGRVELDDGTWTSGFLCEPRATVGAREISSFGGWRAFRRGPN